MINHLVEQFLIGLQNLDPAVFVVPAQNTDNDRRSLLAVQKLVRNALRKYVYLEIGSHIGGTLLPHLLDPHCHYVISVDKRPESMLDGSGVVLDYIGNSTQRMLETLAPHAPPSAFLKLTTHDADISEIDAASVAIKANLAFIDAEHTNVAVFRDFLHVLPFLADSAIVIFHDSDLLFEGLLNIETVLRYSKIEFRLFFLPNIVYVILFGEFIHIGSQPIQDISVAREEFIHYARVNTWRKIAENAQLMQGFEIGHIPPE